MRKTKIICTIGPASESLDCLKSLIWAGMNVARFNFSHGSYEEHKIKFQNLVHAREELNSPVAALIDTKGPEIRLSCFEEGKVDLKANQLFTLTTQDILGTNQHVSISYKNLPNDVKPGDRILIDDGLVEMKVEETIDNDIICRVMNNGMVSDRKGINVPGVSLSMPYINETDRADIRFAIEMGFDFIAISFVRSKNDVLEVREILNTYKSNMKIISKIENKQGLDNAEEILIHSDGIMIARGDLGVEIPLEEVPIYQKKLIKEAAIYGKYVITATQMLESMIHNPRPTRAEATDIANAIYDGSTAIMLSGESAVGNYPVEAVTIMSRIAEAAEKDIDYGKRLKQLDMLGNKDITTAIAYATCTTAMELNAAAIITVTLSGFTAVAISRFKPGCQIIGCTTDYGVARQLNLLWGIKPIFIKEEKLADELFADAVAKAKENGYVTQGDIVVITAGVPLGITGNTNMIRVVEVE